MYLLDLPDEILILICNHCYNGEQIILQTVCKKFREIIPSSYNEIRLSKKYTSKLRNIEYCKTVIGSKYFRKSKIKIHRTKNVVIYDDIKFLDMIDSYEKIYIVRCDDRALKKLISYRKPITFIRRTIINEYILYSCYDLLKDCIITKRKNNNLLHIQHKRDAIYISLYEYDIIEICKSRTDSSRTDLSRTDLSMTDSSMADSSMTVLSRSYLSMTDSSSSDLSSNNLSSSDSSMSYSSMTDSSWTYSWSDLSNDVLWSDTLLLDESFPDPSRFDQTMADISRTNYLYDLPYTVFSINYNNISIITKIFMTQDDLYIDEENNIYACLITTKDIQEYKKWSKNIYMHSCDPKYLLDIEFYNVKKINIIYEDIDIQTINKLFARNKKLKCIVFHEFCKCVDYSLIGNWKPLIQINK